MQVRTGRCSGQDAEAWAAHAARFDLGLGRIAHVAHDERQAQGDAGERMIAVEDNVIGVDLGHGVDRVLRQAGGDRAGRRPLELHAGLDDAFGEDFARLEEDELRVVLAEGVLGLEMKRRLETCLPSRERFLDLGEEVVAAEEEFDRLAQLVDLGALCIGQTPGEADDAGRGDFHQLIIAQWGMDPDRPMALLGGLSAAAFMRRHWQKKPLLVRAACPGALADVDRSRLFALAARDDVESRLVVRTGARWSVRPGPVARRALPALATPAWTLLVQGVDLHDDAAHRLLRRFRFIADARLDDVMCSYASDSGGVGPHVDSYDVFLLQTLGRRRWRIGRTTGARLRDAVPLKMLADFAPSEHCLLDPGDMLYLPPGWGHDGVAVGECITASIGFRAPQASDLAADMAQRIAEAARDEREGAATDRRYRDRGAAPVDRPALIPESLQRFADDALDRLLGDGAARARALGETLSEPKPGTWFERAQTPAVLAEGIALDRRTRMLYDDRFVFVNGEAYRARGRDATLMRLLADGRRLDARSVAGASLAARTLLSEWLRAGWCATPSEPFDEETT